MKSRIYADHAATTPICEEALIAMKPWFDTGFYNPSALYDDARRCRKAVELARDQIAEVLNAQPDEIYFTSGGTESDNWALKALRMPNRPGIVTSCIEHHAILNTCAYLSELGRAVVQIGVDATGRIDLDELERLLSQNSAFGLVSVMLVNNEVGTIEPLDQVCALARRYGAFVHTDAVQAVGHIPVDVQALGVDMLSASAHKFNGPKGTGFLYVRRGTPLAPFLHGGGQERGLRSTTENVPGIVGMAAALVKNSANLAEETKRLRALRDQLIQGLHAQNLDFRVNGAVDAVPGIISLSFCHASGEAVLHQLDLMGIDISTGSACDSRQTQISHVIRCLGVSPDYAAGTIRVSLGINNSAEQVDAIVKALGRAMRAAS